ncbi:MAG TPA: PQQ-binding-like beta-propeller repeat protein [Marmoricola sp.]|nr:PQQ-binding-like beta-propeller repeat protein [Marmoricola sp.]
MVRRSLTLLTALLCLLLAACGSSGGDRADGRTAGSPARAPGSGDGQAALTGASPLPSWPTYHRTTTRSGHVATGPGTHLRKAWSRRLVGQVYGEPLVVDSTLVVATERNFVYGLDPRTGDVRWRSRQLGAPQPLSGLPCGNIDPLGITGTPAYDPATGSVFVAAETSGGTHTLWALDPDNGSTRWHRNLDTQPDRDKLAEQQRSALLVTRGRVIVTFGGLAGDCGDYVGYVASVPTDGQGSVASYAVPTAREGGIWAPPGAVAGPNGTLYVGVGNGASGAASWDRSDSVTELTAVGLRRVSAFAPSTWREDNRLDLDLGSSSPVMVPAAGRVVMAGKRGVVYLLRPSLGGIGSQVRTLAGCRAFGGAAVVGRTVLLPCKGEYAIRALHVGTASLSWGWRRSGVYSSPVVAGRRVYVADEHSGDLVVLGLARGRVLARYHAGPLPHFPSQVVSGPWVFVPTLRGVTAFRGS